MRIALIGFGEVGQILAADLADHEVAAFDLLFADPASGPSRAAGALHAATAGEAVAGAELVVSCVTAAATMDAARSVTGGMGKGAIFLDLNSASPGTKQSAAGEIEAAGGRYVEAAVMSPIHPKRIASPMLLGGPHARALAPTLQALGFTDADPYADQVGPASATKMCRSVMIKGLEALLTESLLAARRYGVEDYVLGSLSNLVPHPDWPGLARYMISRSVEHGTRRAEEMREAVQTVADAGVTPLMSHAIAARQDWAADHKDALATPSLPEMLDRMLRP